MTSEKIERSMSPTEKQKLDDLRSLVSDFESAGENRACRFQWLASRVDGIQTRYDSSRC